MSFFNIRTLKLNTHQSANLAIQEMLKLLVDFNEKKEMSLL